MDDNCRELGFSEHVVMLSFVLLFLINVKQRQIEKIRNSRDAAHLHIYVCVCISLTKATQIKDISV